MYLCDVYVNSTPGWLESFAVFFPRFINMLFPFKIVMICWSPVRSYNLWKIEITENSVTSFIFSSSEFLAWVFIYGGSLLLDFPELVGVKQVQNFTIIT